MNFISTLVNTVCSEIPVQYILLLTLVYLHFHLVKTGPDYGLRNESLGASSKELCNLSKFYF